MRHAVGLVGEPVGRAETLGGAYGAGPFAGMDIRVKGAVSLEAVLFGSGRKHRQMDSESVVYFSLSLESRSFLIEAILF